MKVRVLFFSLLRDIAGCEEMDFELPEGSIPVSQLLSLLYETFDGLKSWDEKLLVAVNCEYSSREDVVNAGDEIAIMPPVQGG